MKKIIITKILILLFPIFAFSKTIVVSSVFNEKQDKLVTNQNITSFLLEKNFLKALEIFYSKNQRDFTKIDVKKNRKNLFKFISSYKNLKSWKKNENAALKTSVEINSLLALKNYSKFIKKNNELKALPEGQKLLIKLDYRLKGFTWRDLNFFGEEDFKKSLIDSWRKWIQKDFAKRNFNFLVIEYNEDFERSLDNDSYVLNVFVKLSKKLIDKEFKRYEFFHELDYGVSNFELKNLSGSSLLKESKGFEGVEDFEIPNLIANSVYRLPLSEFISLKSKILGGMKRTVNSQILVKSYKNFSEINKLINLLGSYGSNLLIEASVGKIAGNSVSLNVNYSGTDTDLVKLIRLLETKESGIKLLSKEFPISVSIGSGL